MQNRGLPGRTYLRHWLALSKCDWPLLDGPVDINLNPIFRHPLTWSVLCSSSTFPHGNLLLTFIPRPIVRSEFLSFKPLKKISLATLYGFVEAFIISQSARIPFRSCLVCSILLLPQQPAGWLLGAYNLFSQR